MYNLLVKWAPWEMLSSGEMSKGRVFEYTEKYVRDRFQDPHKGIDFDKLKLLPCLLVQEGRKNQIARVATITGIRTMGKVVKIHYSIDTDINPIHNKDILAHADAFRIDYYESEIVSEFDRTHWAIKDVNLFRAIVQITQSSKPKPEVFSISPHETIDPSAVSVMMPFDKKFDQAYESIKNAAAECNLTCNRADGIWEEDAIIQDIVNLINRSFIVVCDCTGRNPNVFYEMGIAHTLGRQVVMITQSKEDVPFDVNHLRFIAYHNNGEGVEKLKKHLVDRFSYLKQQLS